MKVCGVAYISFILDIDYDNMTDAKNVYDNICAI